jgi:lysophospholipase L1-like esterase
MHLDMLKPKVRMQRFAVGEVPKDLPEHAFEVVVEPGTRRDIVFVEPPANSVKNAYPGRIEVPFFFEPRFYTLRYDENAFLLGGPRDAVPDAEIVMLGDSTLEDRYLPEDARTSSRLAAALRELTGKKINVHNAAVSGATSLNSLVTLFVKLIALRPRAVTLMHVSNDLKQLLYFGSHWATFGRSTVLRERPEPAASPWTRLRRDPLRTLGRAIARLVRLVDRRSRSAAPERLEKQAWWEYMAPQAGFAERDPRRLTEMFATNLNIFVSVCRDAGIIPVLLTQPNRLTNEGPDELLQIQMRPLFALGMSYAEYKGLFDAFNDAVRNVARERAAILVDAAALVPQEPRYIWDSIHLTEQGASLVADITAKALRELVSKP